MASNHTQQIEDLQFRVLRQLQEQPDLSQRDLAALTGSFLKRKIAEYKALCAEINALQSELPSHASTSP